METSEEGSNGNMGAICPRLWPVPSEIVGFETQVAELESWLLDNEFKHKVIFLVGMGGVGKTTLAETVYNKPSAARHFICRAWITASESCNDLLDSMLAQFDEATSADNSAPPEEDDGAKDDEEEEVVLKRKLSARLEEERYVVIFDNVWDVSFCERAKDVLPATKRGCTVLITTRVRKNLEVWWPVPFFVRVLELMPLDQETAADLFYRNLSLYIWERSLDEIVDRCGGLPLALVVVGNVLSRITKRARGESSFLDSFSLRLKFDPLLSTMAYERLLPRHHLPPKLEACFLYLGIYPKGCLVRCARLVRQWMAEGLVKSKKMGEDYLSELVNLSLVQVSDTDVALEEKPGWCRVHAVMHDVIRSLCSTETPAEFRRTNFLTHLDEESIDYHERRQSASASCFAYSHARPRFPFMVDHDDDGTPKLSFNIISAKWFANNKLLQMLDFEGSRGLVCVPEEVGSLVCLKYLSVRNTMIMTLPKSIGKLQKLQTLDLKYSLVCELPLEINTLRELQYILAYYYGKRSLTDRSLNRNSVRGVKINEGFGHSEGLRKLYHVEANNDVGLMKELRKFSQLEKLGVAGLTRETSRALCTSLDFMYQLESLQLFSASEDETLDLQSLSIRSPRLRSLALEGRLECVPHSVSRLQSLERLHLRSSKLMGDPLVGICYLVFLTKLELYDNAFVGEQLRFSNDGFQSLKVLVMRGLPRLTSVDIGTWALPSLEEFSIGESPNLTEVPVGIQNLRRLKTLEFYDMGDEFGLSMVPNGGEFYYVVQHISQIRFYYKRDGGKRYDIFPLR